MRVSGILFTGTTMCRRLPNLYGKVQRFAQGEVIEEKALSSTSYRWFGNQSSWNRLRGG